MGENSTSASRQTVFHPMQTNDVEWRHDNIPESVALRAYEVYRHVHGPQPAMIDLEGRNCRGGFGVGEIIAFLYARSFPMTEWGDRVQEALQRKPK